MKKSFHGRSMGALSITGKATYQEPFAPMLAHVKFADFNNLDSVKRLITKNTCAIFMETVQGESGIYPTTEYFIKGVRKLCDENKILMVLDEIQCGMGRSGNMFAYQLYDVAPDIVVYQIHQSFREKHRGSSYNNTEFEKQKYCGVF